jgi:lysophospholipase L1-like esterase
MKNYEGKYFSVYGDSISTLSGYNPFGYEVFYNAADSYESGVNSFANTWWGMVIQKLNGQLLVNNSWSGSLVTKQFSDDVSSACSSMRLACLGRGRIEPDVIMVFMGTNDRGGGVPLKGDNLKSFSYAYSYMLGQINDIYPNAEIWCLTLGNIDGKDSYSQTIRECAAAGSCKLLDLNRYDPYSKMDGIHPDKAGMREIADAVLKELEAE